MSRKVLAWQIEGDSSLSRLNQIAPDLEKNLEDWIEKDPNIVAPDVLIIGRQLKTDYGAYIDLLGIEEVGDLVIIELKRDRTLRETVAQTLEYAAWSSRLNYEQIMATGQDYYENEGQFLAAFRDRFGCDLPDTLNQAQKMILVAPEISDSVRAVVKYLSESYGVPINAVSFDLFDVDGKGVLVRETVLTEEEEDRSPASKRRAAPTIEQFLDSAKENGVGEIADYLWSLNNHFLSPQRYTNGWGFRLRAKDGRYLTVFTVFPTKASFPDKVGITFRSENLSALFNRPIEESQKLADRLCDKIGQREPGIWQGWSRLTITDLEQARQFIAELAKFADLRLVPETET